MSETEIRHASPEEGFDRSEPKVASVTAFAVGSVILLIATILSLQAYFNKIWDDAVYEKILAPPSEELKALHYREDWFMKNYSFTDKKAGVVRIPLDEAMQKFAAEAAEGKLFYPAKSYVPKKEDPAAPSGAAGAAPAK